MLDRRTFTLSLAAASLLPACAARPQPRFLADSHSHYGMQLPGSGPHDLAKEMKDSGTTLIAWAVVDDLLWLGVRPTGVFQAKEPQPGDLWRFFHATMAKHNEMLAKWGLEKALTPKDVDWALAGEPRIVMAVESANFLEGDASRVAQAWKLGVRHLQLVHYIHSPLGDHQTEKPDHGGLSAMGRDVVLQCKRHGILVDLAHSSPATVEGALDAAPGVMIWSHSWISATPHTWEEPANRARSLTVPLARKIAARGGVIGLWTVRVKSDPDYPVHDVQSFADETMRMCDVVGPEHVAFGTDMEGAGPNAILSNYGDLRRVADNLAQRGLPDAVLHGIFIGNYARALKQAMSEAKA
jgi:membrane dipeptidase